MKSYLLFQLYAPMQSWGDVAVGEIRADSRIPTKSAILGILGGALGVRRKEEALQNRMASEYGVAVRQDAKGIPFRDFHTVQTASAKKGRFYQCRTDLLGAMLEEGEGVNTIITYRDYTADAGFTVCVWATVDDPPFAFPEIAKALRKPQFNPYLGRKSCPPALPFAPEVVEAESVKAALSMYPMDGKVAAALSVKTEGSVELTWDTGAEAGVREVRTESSRDVPVSRQRWQFTVRGIFVGNTDCPKRREWE